MGILEKFKSLYAYALVAMGGVLLAGQTAWGAPSSTPEEVLATAVDTTIDSGVDIFTYVITNYMKYILILGVVIGLIAIFKKFAHLGAK